MDKGWPKDIYNQAGIQELILAAFYNLQQTKPTSFSRLLEECFVLFPDRFSFQNYPQWPDSRKLDRPLRLLREEKLVDGSPEQGFSLTKQGKKKASQVINMLRQKQLDLR